MALNFVTKITSMKFKKLVIDIENPFPNAPRSAIWASKKIHSGCIKLVAITHKTGSITTFCACKNLHFKNYLPSLCVCPTKKNESW